MTQRESEEPEQIPDVVMPEGEIFQKPVILKAQADEVEPILTREKQKSKKQPEKSPLLKMFGL